MFYSKTAMFSKIGWPLPDYIIQCYISAQEILKAKHLFNTHFLCKMTILLMLYITLSLPPREVPLERYGFVKALEVVILNTI